MTDEEEFIAYVTTHALTKGIVKVLAHKKRTESSHIWWHNPGGMMGFAHRDNWHRSIQDAHDRVHQMVLAKEKSLKKQLAKLEKFREDPNLPKIVVHQSAEARPASSHH